MSSLDTMSVHAANAVTGASNERVPEPIAVNVPHKKLVATPSHTVDHVSPGSPQQNQDSAALDRSKTTGETSSDYITGI
jgi:hypothetical protein